MAAKRASGAMNELTGRWDLASMTMLRLARAIPTNAPLMRARLAWCPICLKRDFDQRARPYIRLYWLIRAVSCCSTHRLRLCEICPSCGRRPWSLPYSGLPGYCCHCGTRLDQASSDKTPQSDWDLWSTVEVRRALTTDIPETFDVAERIQLACRQTTDGVLSAFARLMEESVSALCQWRLGRVRPMLPSLLRLCYLLGISLDGFLRGDFIAVFQPSLLASAPVATVEHPGVATKELVDAMSEYLNSDELTSLKDLQRSLGVALNSLERASPQLAAEIRRQGTLQRRAKRLGNVAAKCVEVRRAVHLVAARGAVPTQGQVREVVKNRHVFREPAALRAYHEARAELLER